MVDARPPQGRRRHPGGASDDGWGPATSVHSAAYGGSGATPAAPVSAPPRMPQTRSAIPPPAQPGRRGAAATPPPGLAALDTTAPRPRERGLPAWAALVVLLVIAGVGGIIDTISGAQVRGGFNIGIILASIVAILAVRRSSMFPVVVAPPLVYSGASATMLYLRSGGLHDRRVLLDGAANWLVYGFPAIAGATAAVLIIAGIRLVTHR